MTDTITRTELTDKLALVVSQSDTKFERLLGQIQTSNAELRGQMETSNAQLQGQIGEMNARLAPLAGMKTTIIGTGVAVVAVVIGVLTYGQQWFGTGVTIRDTIRATVTEMHVQAPPPPPVKP